MNILVKLVNPINLGFIEAFKSVKDITIVATAGRTKNMNTSIANGMMKK
ncbi:hypothetical protein KCTCHS21_13350 [Cohnella abietis]|uniref:Uncharacterized protein n=1 Tax=Cohnella abietis TaxID=2507935 RepID=A0A3T1D1G5_9BACL|nr:hypothetical protein KCTCHS21_13350 [Cohnella abietis]